jgi:kynurenine formamidase
MGDGRDDGTGRRRLVELSHLVRPGMITHPGLPGPEISDHLSRAESRGRYAAGTEFQIGRITMVANTGTYVDAPSHRFADGADLTGVPLSRLADVDAVVVRATGDDLPAIGSRPFERAAGPAATALRDRAVLVHTGWDRHWGTDRYGTAGHPFLTAEAVAWLVAREPAVVGIDSVNIDDLADGTRPAHTGLLAAGIPIVEHLCGLDQVPGSGFRFHAAPVAVAGMGTFPVRAYAVLG